VAEKMHHQIMGKVGAERCGSVLCFGKIIEVTYKQSSIQVRYTDSRGDTSVCPLEDFYLNHEAVSYTHLTLPTKA